MLYLAVLLLLLFLFKGVLAKIGASIVSSPSTSFQTAFAYSGVCLGMSIAVELVGFAQSQAVFPPLICLSGASLIGVGIVFFICHFAVAMWFFQIGLPRAFFFLLFQVVASFAISFAVTHGVNPYLGLQPISSSLRGAYFYDARANSALLHSRLLEQFSGNGGTLQPLAADTLQISHYSIAEIAGGEWRIGSVKTVEKGDGFLVFETFDHRLQRYVRYRVEPDCTGIWITSMDMVPSFRAHFLRASESGVANNSVPGF
jgi:hypothetical protein